jgi:RNA polymerase sigma-70 factor (ECF subfamily)
LRRIAGDDAMAMQELFLLERASLHRLFLGLGRCASLADDLVQNTFLGLWRYRANFQARGSAAGYLYRVAIHQWRKSLSRERTRRTVWKELSDDVAEPRTEHDASAPLASREIVQAIWDAIDALPDAQREVFVLHRYHGLSCPEIASAIETNLKTVESRLRLALCKLSERLLPLKEPR